MASKRKTNGCKSVQCVIAIINKLGCEVPEFFARAKHLGYVPPGFNAMKEAILFKQLRDQGIVVEQPNYGIPVGILDFVDDLNESDCPRKLYGDLKHVPRPAPHSPEPAPKAFRPVTMTRPRPAYA